jgi:hypothetical protein
VGTIAVAAQWPKIQTPGLPRDGKGQVIMTSPTPRMPDGKPDLSGVWMRADRDPPPAEIAKIVGNRDRAETVAVDRAVEAFAADPNAPPLATFWNIGANLPGGGPPFTPWAAALRTQRMSTDSKDNPDANCLPMGITQFHMQPQPRMIVHTPRLILIEYEANYGLRKIYLDGRALPKQGDPQPFWYGYSVGRWDGDTLVVETNNLRGAEDGPFDGWLDVNGAPYSNQAKFTERFRRPNLGKLEIDVTVEDPKSYTKPFTVRINQRLQPDEEMIEFVCNENQQFRRRIKID